MLYQRRFLVVHRPSSLYFQLPFRFLALKLKFWLSAAGCFIVAYYACALCGFSAVWAYAVAVVDKVSAVVATRLVFFSHPLRLCHNTSSKLENLRFRKTVFSVLITVQSPKRGVHWISVEPINKWYRRKSHVTTTKRKVTQKN